MNRILTLMLALLIVPLAAPTVAAEGPCDGATPLEREACAARDFAVAFVGLTYEFAYKLVMCAINPPCTI